VPPTQKIQNVATSSVEHNNNVKRPSAWRASVLGPPLSLNRCDFNSRQHVHSQQLDSSNHLTVSSRLLVQRQEMHGFYGCGGEHMNRQLTTSGRS